MNVNLSNLWTGWRGCLILTAIRSVRAQRVERVSAWLRGGIVPEAALTGKRSGVRRQVCEPSFLSLRCSPPFRRSLSAETPTADQVLAPAKAKAAAEHKTIFLHFGASWCGWCKRLDAFLDRPNIKPVFEKYFIPVKLVVQEPGKNKALENPGADALLKNLGGLRACRIRRFWMPRER